jgi:2-C-methyl-D-erythritol 4-phosphate cytidylyltransferase
MKKSGGIMMSAEMIVVAAGRGSRMGVDMKKQYLLLGGEPILVRTLQTLGACPSVERIVLVVSLDDVEFVRELLKPYGLTKIGPIVSGGQERQDSVLNGLRALHPSTRFVAVHDAARPLVSVDEVEAVLAAAQQFGAATLGVPVKDTIKRVENGRVKETLARETLWAVHTPQAFARELLEEAHERRVEEGVLGTDDASLVEWAGYPVHMVRGRYENLKITTPEDLVIAETLWSRKEGESK